MQRKPYVLCFIAFATIFVPVVFVCPWWGCIAPPAYIALLAGDAFFSGAYQFSVWPLGILSIYLLLFYVAARFSFWLSTRSVSPAVRWTIQLGSFAALLFCSFIRVVTRPALHGAGGTYTFWGAASRFLDNLRTP